MSEELGESPSADGSAGPPPLWLGLDAVPENVPVARRAVAEFARACDGNPEHVALAISEAVTNVVLHAYPEDVDGRMRVSAALIGGDLVVTVSDDGDGMKPDPESTGLGMGLPIIGSLTSQTSLKKTETGLEVTMRFPCPGDE